MRLVFSSSFTLQPQRKETKHAKLCAKEHRTRIFTLFFHRHQLPKIVYMSEQWFIFDFAVAWQHLQGYFCVCWHSENLFHSFFLTICPCDRPIKPTQFCLNGLAMECHSKAQPKRNVLIPLCRLPFTLLHFPISLRSVSHAATFSKSFYLIV